jgi:hypothetical protein
MFKTNQITPMANTPGETKLALNQEFKTLYTTKLCLIADWKKKLFKHYPSFNHKQYKAHINNLTQGKTSVDHALLEACKFIVKRYFIVEPKNV